MHRASHEPWFAALLGLAAAVSVGGCDKVRAVVCEPVKAANAALAPKDAARSGDAAKADGGAEAEQVDAKHTGSELLTSQVPRFALPFAWEKSPKEPLARARTYLRELADDNAQYMNKGPAFFQAFADAEAPRATVVTCADSRMQMGSFDATPENDAYTVRNLANQIDNALGSVHYGVDQLHTPVLMILGHTGCTAVKAALSGGGELGPTVAKELEGLKLKPGKGPLDDRRWAAAVIENVHDQVKVALREFGPRVNAAELTIVGAVYDLKNDFGQGQARLIVINVNGIQDPARLKAFGDAIMSTPNPNARAGGGTSDSPLDRLARALADPASHSALGHDESEDDEDEEEPPPAAAPAHPAAPAHGGPAEHGAAAPPVVPVAPVMLAPTQPPPAPAVHESPTHRAVPAKNAAPAKRTKH